MYNPIKDMYWTLLTLSFNALSNSPTFHLSHVAAGSPSPSNRSNRSVSPYKASDSEDEEQEDTRQDVIADVHQVQIETPREPEPQGGCGEREGVFCLRRAFLGILILWSYQILVCDLFGFYIVEMAYH